MNKTSLKLTKEDLVVLKSARGILKRVEKWVNKHDIDNENNRSAKNAIDFANAMSLLSSAYIEIGLDNYATLRSNWK